MQPKAKSNSVVTSVFELATGILTLDVVGVAKVTFNAAKVVGDTAYASLNDMGKRAIGHAFTQRLSDRAALKRDGTTGQSASPQEKYAAIKALADHYENGGGWELAGGGLPPIDRPALYQAVAFVRGLDVVKVEQVYRDKTDEVIRTLLSIAAIAGKYTELHRATAVANPTAEALLAEVMAMKEPEKAPEPAQPETPNKGFRKDGTKK